MATPKSADVYTTAEVDAMFGQVVDEISALDTRVTDLEGGEVDPGPGPDPEGVDLVVTAFAPPPLTQGKAATLSVTVRNAGAVAVPAGTILGVGFLADGVAATWVSTDAGLGAGELVTLATNAAPWTGGAWTPTSAGEVELTAFVDDSARIPELHEDNNQATVTVTIAEGTAPGPSSATLFPASSLWNTPKTGLSFAAGADNLLRSTSWGLNNGPFSHPMAWSSASDPLHTFAMPDTWGWPAQTVQAHMSDDTTPASGSDGHLCLMNADGRLFDMWILEPTGHRSWRCAAWAQHQWVTGSGWGSTSPWASAGVTAAGAPTAAGTITAAEVEAGVIPHALCVAFDYRDQGGVGTSWSPQVFPAISNDVGGGPGPLAEGALLVATGAKPSGLNGAETALFDALATYGAYVVDRLDGIPMFFGDRSELVGNAFRGDKLTAIGRTLRMAITW